jgi:hypothetical protein
MDVAIRCRCGALRGTLHQGASSPGFRVVCYCDDCQAFARFLGDEDSVLDANGGTDILQLSPARLRLAEGADRLACARVTAKGPYRWYTSCCRTPIGNTLPTARIPFLGLINACVDTGGRSLDEVLGPVSARVMAKFAVGRLPTRDAQEAFSIAHVLRLLVSMLRWRLRGDHKRSPFFDNATGEPVAAPRRIEPGYGAPSND